MALGEQSTELNQCSEFVDSFWWSVACVNNFWWFLGGGRSLLGWLSTILGSGSSIFGVPIVACFWAVKFTGKNYSAWEFQFRLFVMGKGLWGHIDGSDQALTDVPKLTQCQTKNARWLMLLKAKARDETCGKFNASAAWNTGILLPTATVDSATLALFEKPVIKFLSEEICIMPEKISNAPPSTTVALFEKPVTKFLSKEICIMPEKISNAPPSVSNISNILISVIVAVRKISSRSDFI
ncbi:hypothetical protein Pint_30917 [Pistacia integerrima]|uniref:Uncharacterized protein n=1 Tax=Pistacia integerrima TaxID=434235 RepID=A0ACC0XQ20_9ROSI|nr:hypothetical protein Pint_30917 [Pistacia integerrima]